MTRKSDLPFGSEFSPSQIDLSDAIGFADVYGGDYRAFEGSVRAAWFESHATSDYNRGKLANNTKLGMIAYGIIDRDATLTEFGRELLAVRTDEPELYRRLAKHILLNLHGMTLVSCIRDMEATGESVTLPTLREALGARGVHFPRGGKHPSMMRLWLAKAGVFVGSRWQVDPFRIEEISWVSGRTSSRLSGTYRRSSGHSFAPWRTRGRRNRSRRTRSLGWRPRRMGRSSQRRVCLSWFCTIWKPLVTLRRRRRREAAARSRFWWHQPRS